MLGVVFEMTTQSTNLQYLSFDSNSMILALQISAFLLIGGVLFDKAPSEKIQRIVRDTRVYTLRIIGRNSDPISAFGVALLLSLAAGLSEELLFRGFLQMWIRQWAGSQLAIMASAALFGLAHFPAFGASEKSKRQYDDYLYLFMFSLFLIYFISSFLLLQSPF